MVLFRDLIQRCCPGMPLAFPARSGSFSRSSEGKTHSRHHPVLISGWQHLLGKAPFTGQGALWPCLPYGKVVVLEVLGCYLEARGLCMHLYV